MRKKKRRGRKRWLVGFAFLAGVSFLSYGIERANGWITAEGRFPVRRIRVSGNHLLFEGEVIALAGIARGTNLAALDPAAAEERLVASPWIRAARVRRRPPGEVRVDVEEARPWLLEAGNEALFVDRAGRRFPAMGKEERLDLPVLVDRSDGRDRVIARLAGAFLPGEDWIGERVAEVTVAEDGSVVLVEAAHGTVVLLGRDDFARRASRLRLVLAEWKSEGEWYEELDLRYGDQAIARRARQARGDGRS